MPSYHVCHNTIISYGAPVSVAWHSAHLRPREFAWQKISDYSLVVSPDKNLFSEKIDYFGNWSQRFSIGVGHSELKIISSFKVLVERDAPLNAEYQFKELKSWLRAQDSGAANFIEFTHPSTHVDTDSSFGALAAPFFEPDKPLIESLSEFCVFLHEELTFDPEATDISTPVTKVLELKRGVCQDFAHLGIACLRSIGIPAAYVSGYLLTNPPPGQPRLVGADASHAWLAVPLPNGDWVELDPTNGCLPTDRHIVLARGRDYSDVSPLKGAVIGGGSQAVKVEVTVMPEDEIAQ